MEKNIHNTIQVHNGIVRIAHALNSKWKNNIWTVEESSYDKLEWDENNLQSKPSEKEITDEINKLQAEYDALEYARARDISYPNLKEFAEAYTEKEIVGDTTKWDAYVINYNKVRTENPK